MNQHTDLLSPISPIHKMLRVLPPAETADKINEPVASLIRVVCRRSFDMHSESSRASERGGRMFRSTMSSSEPSANAIVTMENANVDLIVNAVAKVLCAYTVQAETHPGPPAEVLFDEARHPLDRSGIWTHQPEGACFEQFVRNIHEALDLNDACGVLGLVFLERLLRVRQNMLTRRTWRPVLLVALIIASKSVYDESMHLSDFRERLPQLNLAHLADQEVAFLIAINYDVLVQRRQYAQYYFALLDVAEHAA